jgi:hypothetical protein
MKKIYMLFFAVLFTSGAFAQQANQPAAASRAAQTLRANDGEVYTAGSREVFYTNDFSNCADWTIDNANNAGLTQFVEGLDFVCGTAAPSGSAAIDGIASTTASNGFMMVDSDEFGGEEGGSGIENNWFQNAQPIDCSAYPFVSIKFETFYRMWDNGNSDGNEYCLVEVSRDGVTWPSLTTFEVSEGMVDFGDGDGMVQARWELFPEMETQDPVQNPTVMVFDITSAAGGQEQVWIRFRWKGTWGYAWMVDDVELFETPDDDISVESYFTYTDIAGTGMYEYGVWPTSQLTELQMAARVRNLGINEATNVTLSATVNGADAAMTATPINIAYASADTARAVGYTPPAVEGMYEVAITVTQDAADENINDNTALTSFEITEFSYGRDNSVYENFFPGTTYIQEFQVANAYQFFGDATIYGIDVAFVAGEAEAPVVAHVLDFENLDIVVSSEELELNPEFINTNAVDGNITWYTFRLEDPIDVTAGDGFLASVESFGGSGVRVGRSKAAPDQTCFVYGDFGTAGFDWYFTGSTAMIRFNLDPSVANTPNNIQEVASTNFSLLQNIPNPATGTTLIRYNLNAADAVSFEVMDFTGKRVIMQDLGRQVAGEHQFDLNIADLASGMYTYTLTVGQERATRKMIIK